jgi:hypothetical protein
MEVKYVKYLKYWSIFDYIIKISFFLLFFKYYIIIIYILQVLMKYNFHFDDYY